MNHFSYKKVLSSELHEEEKLPKKLKTFGDFEVKNTGELF
jgi:hypothetical protein